MQHIQMCTMYHILIRVNIPKNSSEAKSVEVFLICLIGWIITKSEFQMYFLVKMIVSIATSHKHSTDPKSAPNLITRHCYKSKYFYKILLNYTCSCLINWSYYGFAWDISTWIPFIWISIVFMGNNTI